ncbi:divisome-associated lipoprotein DalA [Nioella nitratireducens]|uniref:CAP domain-containing protein n=1 Tax=Nioella nitratireducens TaxID=1287720 RepID=UPI0008FCEF6F|nr:CAP domain-containing protein [Nioella nitratireducens]
MLRRSFLLTTALGTLAACAGTTTPRIGPDGRPLPTVYRINPGDTAEIQFRVLDSVNALRQGAGVPQLQLNAELTAAAETHSRDMSLQNRPWHFGSDGSSPIDRAQRAGYRGRVLGENISETYESELETVAAWMQQPDTRDVITDADARDLGFAFFQEPTGKIWWTMVTGDGGTTGQGLPANRTG